MPTDARMTTAETLDERFAHVKSRIAEAAQRSGRRAEDILLVAVTKYAEPEEIRRLMELGHADFGENRVQQLIQRASMAQEWLERIKVLQETTSDRAKQSRNQVLGQEGLAQGAPARPLTAETPLRWHMIGNLQRNKTKKVVELCRLVHSIDNLRQVEDIQQILSKTDRRYEVLLQVNVSGEETKSGVAMSAAAAVCEQIDSMYHVRVRGLMTMAPHSENPEDARIYFSRCRELFEDIKSLGVGEGRFNILSMGMSDDYEIAIEEGANLVRVGSAIFGTPESQEDDDSED